MGAVMVRRSHKPKGFFAPMSLDTATVRRIAKLARIHVQDDEVLVLQGELNAILGYVEQLAEVDVEGVEPLSGGAQMAMRLREDVVTDGEIAEKILANAPDRTGQFFSVPKVVE
jgi:aspartyl-tRNA(Asn)/glutamyl-tRNA(Gln) amidotransferase subunit C